MKRVLLTGGSGFIGRNIREKLSEHCVLYAPTRKELNLLSEDEIRQYIARNKIDIVIHAANPNPVKNGLDLPERMFEDSIRIFMHLYQTQDLYERMYTLGSGAEYGKSQEIAMLKEEASGRFVPLDSYGLAKFVIDKITSGSPKQCNLRIFGCYGDGDHESKFITHCIRCCLAGEAITIRQDCYFDYMHVQDLAKILIYFIYHAPKHHAYNVCTGTRVRLGEIASIVREEMQSDSEILFLNAGLNHEYTGDNARLLEELGSYEFISLREGIRRQIRSEIHADTAHH